MTKSTKIIVVITIIIIIALCLTACNKTVFDTKYQFEKADIRVNAFYNVFLSQAPNIPSSYKSEFNRIKAKFENSMEHLNLHEAVNSKIIFNEILNND